MHDEEERPRLADVVELRPASGSPGGGEHGADAPTVDEPGLRTVIGEVLRDERHRQGRTLADVAREAAVSLPYLSEVERGRKEVSSELLHAVCVALDLTLVQVLERSVERLRPGAQGGPGIQMLAA